MAAVLVKRSSKFSTSFLNIAAKFKMLLSFRQNSPHSKTFLHSSPLAQQTRFVKSPHHISNSTSYISTQLLNFRYASSLFGDGRWRPIDLLPGPFCFSVDHASWQATLDFYFIPKCKHPHEASENRIERAITKE